MAASSMYFLEFLKQFIIPVRPAWDRYLSSLFVAVTGVAAFFRGVKNRLMLFVRSSPTIRRRVT